jgi:threonine/homoserine/homoserine lactone efflux protein
VGLIAAFASTVALTLSNPMTILSFVGIFAGLGFSAGGGALLVSGVFAGSAAWWLLLASLVTLLRTRLTPRVFRTVNIVSGLLILGFAAQALASLVVS